MKLKPRLSYANVTATLALLVAVAGGTTALAGVAKAPKNSVVAKSIKNGNVTAKKLTTTVRVNAQATSVTDPSPGRSCLRGGYRRCEMPEGRPCNQWRGIQLAAIARCFRPPRPSAPMDGS